MCRLALPALNPDGGQIRVLRTVPWLEAYSIRGRIPRRSRGPAGARALRHLPLRRRGAVGEQGRSRRARHRGRAGRRRRPSISSSASIIDSPEGVAGDPGPGERAAGLIEVPRPARLRAAADALRACRGPRSTACSPPPMPSSSGWSAASTSPSASSPRSAPPRPPSGSRSLLRLGEAAPLPGLLFGAWSARVFAGAIHGAVGGYCDHRRGSAAAAAQPSLDRDRRAVARADGISAHRAEHRDGVAAAGLVRGWPLAARGRLRRQHHARVPASPPAIGLGAGGAVLRLMRRTGFGRAWRAYADDARAAALFGVDGRAS